jgi:hypothetical protein
MMEPFWGTMQLELLDSKTWQTREELANAMFEWIECWYNMKGRHSSVEMHGPPRLKPCTLGQAKITDPHRRCYGETSGPGQPDLQHAPALHPMHRRTLRTSDRPQARPATRHREPQQNQRIRPSSTRAHPFEHGYLPTTR